MPPEMRERRLGFAVGERVRAGVVREARQDADDMAGRAPALVEVPGRRQQRRHARRASASFEGAIGTLAVQARRVDDAPEMLLGGR